VLIKTRGSCKFRYGVQQQIRVDQIPLTTSIWFSDDPTAEVRYNFAFDQLLVPVERRGDNKRCIIFKSYKWWVFLWGFSGKDLGVHIWGLQVGPYSHIASLRFWAFCAIREYNVGFPCNFRAGFSATLYLSAKIRIPINGKIGYWHFWISRANRYLVFLSRAGWANSITSQKLSVCVSVC